MTTGDDDARPTTSTRVIVVLGVSGSGKSTIGRSLAGRLGYAFCDADDLHSRANIEKMASGHPLTDEDRQPWLNAVGQRLSETVADGDGVVAACSALKKRYRDIIRSYEPLTFFILLQGSEELILSRVTARKGSFMPPTLLGSQFATLEALDHDEMGLTIDVDQDVDTTVQRILVALRTTTNLGHPGED